MDRAPTGAGATGPYAPGNGRGVLRARRQLWVPDGRGNGRWCGRLVPPCGRRARSYVLEQRDGTGKIAHPHLTARIRSLLRGVEQGAGGRGRFSGGGAESAPATVGEVRHRGRWSAPAG